MQQQYRAAPVRQHANKQKLQTSVRQWFVRCLFSSVMTVYGIKLNYCREQRQRRGDKQMFAIKSCAGCWLLAAAAAEVETWAK